MEQKLIIRPVNNGCIVNEQEVMVGSNVTNVGNKVKTVIESYFGSSEYPFGSKESIEITINIRKI